MQQRRPRAAIWILVALAACKPPVKAGSAFVADVTVDGPVKADCISVFATSTAGTTSIESNRVARKASLEFGVAEGNGLTGTIQVTARGYLGSCDDGGTLNAETLPTSVTFVEGSASQVVTLELSGALDDGDHDGYRSNAHGGTDCDDSDPTVHPGATELCGDSIDNDCNGLTDCADVAPCEGSTCSEGLSCLPPGVCGQGVCKRSSAGCMTPPPGSCLHGPPACAGDGGCQWQVDAGAACDDGGACRADGTCAAGGTEANCSNGLDDDGDGLTDCADSDCLTQACDDRDGCTVNDVCQSVSDAGCVGAPNPCNTPPGVCFAATGTCAAGACAYPVMLTNTCSDGNPCTTGDTCLADAGCGAGAAVTCTMADDGGCFAPTGTCDTQTGACSFPVRAGMSCDDGNLCTRRDMCSSTGMCSGAAFTCNTPPECASGGACAADGGCAYTLAPAASLCDGGLCSSTGTCIPTMWKYLPSNFNPVAIPDSGIAGVLVITCAAVFNSTSMTFTTACPGQAPTTPMVQPQDGGPDAVLVAVGGLQISGKLRLEGTRPVIFAVYGDVSIDGGVDVSSPQGGPTPGAGAMLSGDCGARAGVAGLLDTNGIGGGGGGGAWASGGSKGGGANGIGGDGGAPLARPALVPLLGGCPGAVGGGPDGTPGNGGGALQISATGSITIDGVVSTSGGGGTHGVSSPHGGAGAGSGGALLLEGVSVVLTPNARVTANGGGGGQGAGPPGPATGDGENGDLATAVPADGGFLSAFPTAGAGGSGATITSGAGTPGDGTQGGGGGGGGLGRLHMNGYPTCKTMSGSLVSAAMSKNSCN